MTTYDIRLISYRRTGQVVHVEIEVNEERGALTVPLGRKQCSGAVRLDFSVSWTADGVAVPGPIAEHLDRVYHFEERKRL